jgi:Rrf2 family protein
MRISKKAEYALRAVVAMARTPQKQPVPIQELSRTARVPVKFLEQILLILKRGGILRSKRGVGGGYQLEKRPAEISLGEIVRLIDGRSVLMGCAAAVQPARKAPRAGPCECGQPGGCGLGKSFARLQDLVAEYLDAQSIQDVLALERPEDALAFEI